VGGRERGSEHTRHCTFKFVIDAADDLADERACEFTMSVPAHAIGNNRQAAARRHGISFRQCDEADEVLIDRPNAANVRAHGRVDTQGRSGFDAGALARGEGAHHQLKNYSSSTILAQCSSQSARLAGGEGRPYWAQFRNDVTS
jgi:hypothetical protein